MHLNSRAAILTLGTLILIGCHHDATSPFVTRTYLAASADGGPVPATHYCAPIASNVDQFVSVGPGSLELKDSGRFTLILGTGYGTQQYHLDAAGARVLEGQSATGEGNYLTGGVVTDASGTPRLRWDRQLPAPDIIGDFNAWLSGDSAVVTVRIDCPRTIGSETSHTFTVVLH
jgi:hypothetical protein